MDYIDDQTNSIASQRTQYERLYRNYLLDKDNSHMIFKIYTDGTVGYERQEKHIGFQYGK